MNLCAMALASSFHRLTIRMTKILCRITPTHHQHPTFGDPKYSSNVITNDGTDVYHLFLSALTFRNAC